MSGRVSMIMRYGCYVLGGVVLSLVGPALWNTQPLVAVIASAATTLCFCIGDVLFETRRIARRALAATAWQQAQLSALGDLISRLETRREPPAPSPEPAKSPVVEPADPAEETASNLLQFAAHVSARCGKVAEAPAQTITDDIAAAIADARTELHLQPIVSLPDRRTVHYEALTRLRSRSGAVVMPAEFLPAAAATGLTADLDTRQLAGLVSLCNRIGDRHPETRLFCNLAQSSLLSDAFRAELIDFMRGHQALSQRIVFEIDAETATALNTEIVADIRALEAMGFAFSVDKVPLTELTRIQGAFRRLGYVKIDADTLADADPNVLKGMAKNGAQVIAVRVETERQAMLANRLGIGLGQGFLFGRPRPARMDDAAQRRAA